MLKKCFLGIAEEVLKRCRGSDKMQILGDEVRKRCRDSQDADIEVIRC